MRFEFRKFDFVYGSYGFVILDLLAVIWGEIEVLRLG